MRQRGLDGSVPAHEDWVHRLLKQAYVPVSMR